MQYYLTPELKKELKKIKLKRQLLFKKIQKKLNIFEFNYRHPSLQTHKLKHNLNEFWSISINKSIRMLYYLTKIENDITAVFFMIGTHDQVYKPS